MTYTLRDYQLTAKEAMKHALGSKRNSVAVIPTGGGKSLVIASLLSELGGKSLVLQPSKEILETNLSKAVAFGFDNIGVWSASCREKTHGDITFAMIGSVLRHAEEFHQYERIVVDECHLVNSREGCYEQFIRSMNVPVIGVTATPFRMRNYRNVQTGEIFCEMRCIVRTRPRIFSRIVHITQVRELIEQGFWSPLVWSENPDYDPDCLQLNSTGMDFTDESMAAYHKKAKIVERIIDVARSSDAKRILVFTKSRDETASVLALCERYRLGAAEVNAETPAKMREATIERFRNGGLRMVVNVGVLTTGFDLPELDAIVLARPMQSAVLYYQMIGRGVRPAEGKEHCHIYDLCRNSKRFGRVESFELVDASMIGKWELMSDVGQLSHVNLYREVNRSLRQRYDLAVGKEQTIPFGRFKGTPASEIPGWYLKWGADRLKGKWAEWCATILSIRSSSTRKP